MTQDGLTLYYTVKELNEQITRCKIDKIHQPRPDTLVLSLRAPAKNLRLLISAGAFDSRLHLTDRKYENPKTPPMFCMFMRKHIGGAKITNIEQTGLERIVTITLAAKDELGLPQDVQLVMELMGKHSNVMLIKDGVIMDCLKHVTRSISRVRCVLPGLSYQAPESSKLNPLTISQTTLTEMLGKRGLKAMKPYLSSILQGISGPTADEILFRYMPSGYSEQPKEAERLSDAILNFFAETPSPILYLRDGVPLLYAPRRFAGIAGAQAADYTSFNKLIDDYHNRIDTLQRLSAKREKLKRLVAKQIEKHAHTLQKQQISAKQAQKAETHKARGDLITANIHRIVRGQRILVATDYQTGEDMALELDTRISPAANAQKQYKRYAKLKAGFDITMRRMQETQSDITFLQSVQVSLDACETKDELNEIEYELSKAGFLPRTQTAARITKTPSIPHRFTSSDGLTIYAGKNNRQNDLLTVKTAAPEDMWLHTKDIPGSHVIITGTKGDVPDATLFEAATIAATLSKAGQGAKVQVDYTPRKNVRKPSGAKPGMVVYEGHSSVFVTPDKALLERLKVIS